MLLFFLNIFSSLSVYLYYVAQKVRFIFFSSSRLNVGAQHIFAQAGTSSYPRTASSITLGNEAAHRIPHIFIPKLSLLLIYCPHCFWVQFLAIALSGVVGITKFAMFFVSWFAWVVTSSHSMLCLGSVNETFDVVFAAWHLIAGKSSLPQLSANEHN